MARAAAKEPTFRSHEEKLAIIREYGAAAARGKGKGKGGAQVAKRLGVLPQVINKWRRTLLPDEKRGMGRPRKNSPPPAPSPDDGFRPPLKDERGRLLLGPTDNARLRAELLAVKSWEDIKAIARRWGIGSSSVYGRCRTLGVRPPSKRELAAAAAPDAAEEATGSRTDAIEVKATPVASRRRGRAPRTAVADLVEMTNTALARVHETDGGTVLRQQLQRMLTECIRYGRSIGVEVVSIAVNSGTVTVTTQNTETYDL